MLKTIRKFLSKGNKYIDLYSLKFIDPDLESSYEIHIN